MSEENVELVRGLYESGLFDRDPDELLQLATPDIEYVNPPYAVEPGVRRGLVAVAQAMRRSKSKPGCEQSGSAPISDFETRSATPE